MEKPALRCEAGRLCVSAVGGAGPAPARHLQDCATCGASLCSGCHANKQCGLRLCQKCTIDGIRLSRAAFGHVSRCYICSRTVGQDHAERTCLKCNRSCCDSCALLCGACQEFVCRHCIVVGGGARCGHDQCVGVCGRCNAVYMKSALFNCFYCQRSICGLCHCYSMEEGIMPTHCLLCH